MQNREKIIPELTIHFSTKIFISEAFVKGSLLFTITLLIRSTDGTSISPSTMSVSCSIVKRDRRENIFFKYSPIKKNIRE